MVYYPHASLPVPLELDFFACSLDKRFRAVGLDPIDFPVLVDVKKVKVNVTGKMCRDFVLLQISVPVPIQFRKVKAW